MPYHVIPDTHVCPIPRCTKVATHLIRSHRNEPVGRYCSKHAEWKCKELNDEEARWEAERRRTDL